ncbi:MULTISPECIES: hypothetical protein [unclassified Microbacterium]
MSPNDTKSHASPRATFWDYVGSGVALAGAAIIIFAPVVQRAASE